jgi:hypothetical protein
MDLRSLGGTMGIAHKLQQFQSLHFPKEFDKPWKPLLNICLGVFVLIPQPFIRTPQRFIHESTHETDIRIKQQFSNDVLNDVLVNAECAFLFGDDATLHAPKAELSL